MYLPRFSHFILFLAAMLLAILGAHWFNGYDAARRAGEDISYPQYVRQQLSAVRAGLKELPDILRESRQSGDDVVRGSMLKLSDALEIYNINTGLYPQDISELLGDYISQRNTLIRQVDFSYQRTLDGGYEMSVILPVSGEEYVIRK